MASLINFASRKFCRQYRSSDEFNATILKTYNMTQTTATCCSWFVYFLLNESAPTDQRILWVYLILYTYYWNITSALTDDTHERIVQNISHDNGNLEKGKQREKVFIRISKTATKGGVAKAPGLNCCIRFTISYTISHGRDTTQPHW